jgi:hypothetical protein
MKAYIGTFTKKDGSERQMNFVRLADLPETVLSEQIKGTGRSTKLAEGMEVVWDLESKAFRIFNWKTTTTDVSEVEVDNPFAEK